MSDTVALRVALQEERAADLAARVQRLLAPLAGDERVLDVGCGTGALALALAPHVREVVGVDSSPDLLAARASARPRTARFSKETRPRSRSAGASSISSAACASCTTCGARSWSSPSSRA